MNMLDSYVHQKIQFSRSANLRQTLDLSCLRRGPVIKFDNQWGIWNRMRTNEATSGAVMLCRTPHGCVD